MAANKVKVLISSRSFGKIDSDAVVFLKNAGIELVFNPYNRKLKEEEFYDLLDGVAGIIAGTENITGKVISNADQLKVISRYGVGLDNVDLKIANQNDILVCNTPETPALAVAELTIALMFDLLRSISKTDRAIRNGSWHSEKGYLLSNKTIGIMGLGRIGQKVVQLLDPFNIKFLAYEKTPNNSFISKYNINLVSTDKLLCQSDIITLHLPLTEQTRGIIGESELSKMKKNAMLINTARGGLIEENALYNALKNSEIAGAALDVFEIEPYEGKLKELDNIILTSHIGSLTVETRKLMDMEAAKNLIKGLKEADVL